MMAVALCRRPCFYCLAHDNVDFDAFLLLLREIEHLAVLDEKTEVLLVLCLVPVVRILIGVGFSPVAATYSLRHYLPLLMALVILGQLDRTLARSFLALFFMSDLDVEIHGFNFFSILINIIRSNFSSED